jgi:hypothetical protein
MGRQGSRDATSTIAVRRVGSKGQSHEGEDARREEEEEQSRIRVALSHSLIGYNKWLRYTSMVFYAHCQVVFLA